MLCLGCFASPFAVHAATNRFEPEILKFEKEDQVTSPPLHGILFVGSSTIHYWKVKELFPDLPVFNRGFGGSEVSDVIYYFDRVVAPYHPDTIVFYSGDNDISAGKTTTTVVNDVKKFVSMVHKELPTTRLIIFPPKPSVAREKLWPEMKQVGDEEKKLAKTDSHVTLLDTTPDMLSPEGRPRPELLRKDGLHMNAKGYKIWSDKLRPLLKAKKN